MNEVQKDIQTALSVLRKIFVHEGDVENMALAKSVLAKAYQAAGEKEEKADE